MPNRKLSAADYEKCAGQVMIRQERNTKLCRKTREGAVSLGTKARSLVGIFASLITPTFGAIFTVFPNWQNPSNPSSIIPDLLLPQEFRKTAQIPNSCFVGGLCL